MEKKDSLILAKHLVAVAEMFAEAASRKEPRDHDPLVHELGDLLGIQISQAVSSMLDRNFPGRELGHMRQAIRIDTINAFKKSLKRNFNSYYDSVSAPQMDRLRKSVEDHKTEDAGHKKPEKEDKSDKKDSSSKKANGQPKPTAS